MSEEEAIYFGDNYVTLYPCTGEFYEFNKENIHQEKYSEKEAENVVKYMSDLTFINPNYKDHYIPAVPETDITMNQPTDKMNKMSISQKLFEFPLIKLPDNIDTKTKYKGIISGHRSSIIKDNDGKYYRFKGCGNDTLGFNLKKGDTVFQEFIIRGCQFETTVLREQFYTEKVDAALKPLGFKCGNYPIGFFNYSKDLELIENNKENQKIKILNSIPEIKKYCGIFRTLGDKRLRTHLLEGFNILFKYIINYGIKNNGMDEKSLETLVNIFPDKRRKEVETYKILKSFGPPTINNKMLTLDEWCKEPVYNKQFFDDLVLNDQLLTELNNNQSLKNLRELVNNNFKEICELGLSDYKTDKQEFIKNILGEILKNKNNKILETIILIFREIGYEVAKVKRVLQDAHINWGTYVDYCPFNLHCNAHANNLIVLPKGNKYLLSPVDFDLSYSKENYVNLLKETPTYKMNDISYYENYTLTEFQELVTNLCGAEDFSSNNQNNVQKEKGLDDKLIDCIKYLCYDSMLECYMKSFDNLLNERLIKDLEENDLVHDIVKLCLIFSHDLIA